MTANAAVKQSPLAAVAFPAGLREVPFLAQIGLRADLSDPHVAKRLGEVLGLELPHEPNTTSCSTDLCALWLGPDEWLIIGPPDTESALEERCRTGLDSACGSVVDVSADRTTVEVWGREAPAILETGCALDLHHRRFAAGRSAQTLVARVPVILYQLTGEPRFRLLVRRSLAPYLAAWLEDARSGLHG